MDVSFIYLTMKYRNYFFVTVLLLLNVVAMAQTGWVLRCERDGIKVYTKKQDNSALKAVKATSIVGASVFTVTDLLLDINNSKKWIYATKRASVLEQISLTEVVYYSEVELPWPISNRDFIADLR